MQPEMTQGREKLDQKERIFFTLASEKLHLNDSDARRALDIILGNIVRRITPEEAMDFLDQMPANLRDKLEDLKAGPDVRINAKTMINDLEQGIKVDGDQAVSLVHNTWRFLEDMLNESYHEKKGELSDVLSQLPADIRNLLTAGDFGASDQKKSV